MAYTPLSKVHFSHKTELLQIYANVLDLRDRSIYKTWLLRRLWTYGMENFALQPLLKGRIRSRAGKASQKAATGKARE